MKNTFASSALLCSALALGLLLTSCEGQSAETQADDADVDSIAVESRADSVAMHVYRAFGGPSAWAALPYLRFDFATGSDTSRHVQARHLWDRRTGDYRIEMPRSTDTVYVALFNVHSREGEVYLKGRALEQEERDELLEQAYRRFINDTYWLLMPVKLFDSGVDRAYVADSSDDGTDVLHLSFGDVGLTPGDEYWVYVDAVSGRVDRWAYRLQHHARDYVPRPVRWEGYKTLDTPGGQILVAERKTNDGFVLYTDNVEAPMEVDADVFSDPDPRL